MPAVYTASNDAPPFGIPATVTSPPLPTYIPSYFSPVPVGAALKSGTIGVAYSETITAQGGNSPYTYAVTAGSLPTGTSLNSSTGVISGTPTVAANYSFTITVTDAFAATGSQAFTIAVSAPAAGGGSSYVFLA